MTDAEFTDELVARLNLFLQADEQRAAATLVTPLSHVGYANVGHFLGQLCLPRGVDQSTPPAELQNVKFLMPVLGEKGRITAFRAVSGAELAEEHAQMQQKMAAEQDKDPKIH